MISNHNLGAIMGAPVQGDDDDKIGTVGQIFVDPESGNPNWVTVHTGLFGRRESFVPLRDATWDHEVLHVPFDKDTIKDAPRIDTDEALSPEHEADLYRYYGIGDGNDRERDDDRNSDDGRTVDVDEQRRREDQAQVAATEAAATADAAEARAEALRDAPATGSAGQGPVRLRKYVVTENKEVTVPVQREEVRVETEGDVQVDTAGAPDVPVSSTEATDADGDRAGDRASDRAGDRVSDRAGDRVSDRAGDRVSDRAAEPAGDQRRGRHAE